MRNVIHRIKTLLDTDLVAKSEMEYLNGAHDLYDLEYRQVEIDRGKFRNRTKSVFGFH